MRTTNRGRTVKSRLTADEKLVELLNADSTPTIFVKTKDGASSSHAGASSSYVVASSPYVPTLDQSRPYGVSSGFFNQGTDWMGDLDEIGRTVASNNWIDGVYLGESSNVAGDPFHHENIVEDNVVIDLNISIEDDEEQIGDEDYVPNPEESSETSESEGETNLYLDGRQMNRALFAEWTLWIQEEGGMQKLLGMMFPQRDGEVAIDTDTEHMRNWLVPLVPARPRDSAVYHEDLLHIDELSRHSIFFSKDEICIAVGLWHLNRKKEYMVVKSDTKRMLMTCKLSTECPFRLYLTSEGGPFTVSNFDEEHTCSEFGLTNTVHKRKVHALVIGSIFAKRLLRDSQIIKPRIIQNELRSEYGIDATYDVCLKGRNVAIEMVYGKHTESFKDLLGYLYMLRISNPETITQHEISPDGRFKQVFVALGATRLAWQNGCIRPVIVVDGTHLKGNAHGLMFVAVAKDANEQLFPLAYGIGPTEDHESWTWFMQCLRVAYGPCPSTLFISDQHASIIHAIQEVFPEAEHGFCYYHLAKNLAIYGKSVGEQFQNAAYTYDKTEFAKFMSRIRDSGRLAYKRLINIGPEKWSRSMCDARRFSNMTSNAAESFNNSLLWTRRLPNGSMSDGKSAAMTTIQSQKRPGEK